MNRKIAYSTHHHILYSLYFKGHHKELLLVVLTFRSVDKAMDNYITPTIQHLLATLYHDKTDSHNYTLAEAVMYDYNT